VSSPRIPLFLVGFALIGLFLGSAQAGDSAPVPAGAPAPAASGTAEAPAPAPAAAAVADSAARPHRVLAYYFHTTKRCASCRKIEAFTAEAVRAGFREELRDGRLAFQTVNLDEKGNEHFVKDYELFTKSVILVDERSGKQVAWKNLPRIWELLNDKGKFLEYVRNETRAYLAGPQS